MSKQFRHLIALALLAGSLAACAQSGIGGVSGSGATNLQGAPGTANDIATGGQGGRGATNDLN